MRFSTGVLAQGPGRVPTILLVDDDASVRRLLARVLTGAGFRVIEAGSAGAALAAGRQLASPIDTLVTDVSMPGMDGFTLGEIFEVVRPTTSVLYMTGDSTVIDTLRRRRVTHHWSLLIKPFRPLELVARLRKLCDLPPPGDDEGPGGAGPPEPS